MSLTTFHEEIIRGDLTEFALTVDADGTDITGMTITLTAKYSVGDSDDDAVFQISTTGGDIVIDDGAADPALVSISIPPDATSGLTAKTLLYADIQIVDGSGNPRTPMRGTLLVLMDVTQTA